MVLEVLQAGCVGLYMLQRQGANIGLCLHGLYEHSCGPSSTETQASCSPWCPPVVMELYSMVGTDGGWDSRWGGLEKPSNEQ